MGLLDGRVAIVTGAGGGIGREHALALAKEGAALVVNDLGGARDGSGGGQSMADQVVDEIKALGAEAVANYDNVASIEGGQNILKTALDTFEQVDILVNNAGILRDKSFTNMTEELWDIVISVHLKGTFCVTQPIFKHMKERGSGGVVINTSSTSGLNGNFGQTNYGAAKMGLLGLSNVLALEGAKYEIRSNVIAPIANTRLTQELLGPLAEKLDPELVTPLSLFLVSEQNQHTHEFYSVGGGRYARVFIGLTQGWFSKKIPSVEEVAAHMDQIRDEQGYIVPGSIAEEMKLLADALRG